ncbi:ParA family protein [Rhizobium sp. L1K21]|uniref:ParA family protein n=1 Tax=Rhizobium sp. L1K21 TaxID=2954933 RepID=UPI002092E7C7|nr:ParA family protein [Rhizobium sp. L1K21]MCO6185605.1 ParA family protein [Rhizobium sp. L1K21]
MPVLAFANSVSGSGKTTSALLAAFEFVHRGYTVAVLDADPRNTAGQWAATAGAKAKLTVISDVTALNVGTLVAQMADRFDMIIIDLPSDLSPVVSAAILCANHVVVPVKSSGANAAAREPVLELISRLECDLGAKISHSVVFTSTQGAGRPQALDAPSRRLNAQGVHVLKQTISKCSVFRAILEGGEPIAIFDPVALFVHKAEREMMRAYSLELMWRMPTLRRSAQAVPVVPARVDEKVEAVAASPVEARLVGANRLLEYARTRVAAAFAA